MATGICPYFCTCNFYNKYSSEVIRREKITIFHEYISVYCYGPLRTHCHRWLSMHVKGENDPANITPSGATYTFTESSYA